MKFKRSNIKPVMKNSLILSRVDFCFHKNYHCTELWRDLCLHYKGHGSSACFFMPQCFTWPSEILTHAVTVWREERWPHSKCKCNTLHHISVNDIHNLTKKLLDSVNVESCHLSRKPETSWISVNFQTTKLSTRQVKIRFNNPVFFHYME